MTKLIDLTGQRFGRLVVLERAENSKNGQARWKCQCDCGNVKIIQGNHLRQGTTKSCGCLEKENLYKIAHQKTHGETKTRLYQIWSGIKQRCNNINSPDYYRYGGRGITICEEWLKYEPFRDWAVNNGYSENLSIDRIDNNKGYNPENCRWITMFEQAGNRRNNHIISYNGEEKTIAEFAREYNIPYATLRARLCVYNWDIEKSLLTPVKQGKLWKEN